MNNNNERSSVGSPRHRQAKGWMSSMAAIVLMTVTAGLMLFGHANALNAQTISRQSPQDPVEATIEGTIHLYLVTNYGEKMQEVDRYRKTGEGSMIAFILKTDKKIDMARYLDKEDLESLSDYAGATLQSEFLVVPDWEVFESFSNEAFASQFANKHVRVSGSFFYPDGGWQNVTPVRMDFSKVEIADPDLGNVDENAEDSSDPMKYYFVFYEDPPEKQAYAKELTNFVEKLLHDKSTFDADLSAKLEELRITLLISPDGKLKLYSWGDGDFGSEISFHSLYQTRGDGEFQAVFMKDYFREPKRIYQVQSSAGPVYLVEYFFRESGWSYDIGVDAFAMDEKGLLQPANVFECIPEIQKGTEGYSVNLALECSPEPPSLYYENAWGENFFFELTGKDFYMPHYINRKESYRGKIMSDFYHRFTWDGNKFRHRQLEFNPVLAKRLPEAGWLMEEVETDDLLVRIDSVADGSYRLIVWDAACMFSSEPVLLVPEGRYYAAKHEYRFHSSDAEYVFDAILREVFRIYVQRLSQAEIEANETSRAVAYNFAMSIINKDYRRMFELATPEYEAMVKEILKENDITVERYFSGEFFKADIVGMRYVMEMGGYDIVVADEYPRDLSPFFQDEPNPFEGLPSICVKLDCMDADYNSYDGSKGDYDTDANVILVKRDGVWRVFTFK